MRNGINRMLGAFNCEIVRKSGRPHDWSDVGQFIPLEETLSGARKAGLTVGEYIDTKHNVPGATRATHERLVALGVFKDRIDRVCEIGPGSGRFVEKTIQACKPSHYEIYETAGPWADYLVKAYKVITQPTDGVTLANTPTSSIDLVQAHKVFVCLLFLTVCSYFTEIVRVTKPGGWVVFDIMTEDCVDEYNLPLWLKTGVNTRTYPQMISKQFALAFFARHNVDFIHSFIVPMKPGRTECMVFRKRFANPGTAPVPM
ncbi:MAG TPA: hypothetical protein VH280_09390 [Verrucomicrobiae bacterium]|nr:hypothetical protein [Verrucomicrobiae bacterium]